MPENSALERVVRRDLEAAGRLDTFHGQLALILAQRLHQEGPTSMVKVADELRVTLALALRGSGPDDEVTRARRARDEKRRQAELEGDR